MAIVTEMVFYYWYLSLNYCRVLSFTAEDGKELLKLPKVKLIANTKREGKCYCNQDCSCKFIHWFSKYHCCL